MPFLWRTFWEYFKMIIFSSPWYTMKFLFAFHARGKDHKSVGTSLRLWIIGISYFHISPHFWPPTICEIHHWDTATNLVVSAAFKEISAVTHWIFLSLQISGWWFALWLLFPMGSRKNNFNFVQFFSCCEDSSVYF